MEFETFLLLGSACLSLIPLLERGICKQRLNEHADPNNGPIELYIPSDKAPKILIPQVGNLAYMLGVVQPTKPRHGICQADHLSRQAQTRAVVRLPTSVNISSFASALVKNFICRRTAPTRVSNKLAVSSPLRGHVTDRKNPSKSHRSSCGAAAQPKDSAGSTRHHCSRSRQNCGSAYGALAKLGMRVMQSVFSLWASHYSH